MRANLTGLGASQESPLQTDSPKDPKLQKKRLHFSIWYVVAAVLIVATVQSYVQDQQQTIKYSEFRAKLDNGLRFVILPDKNTPMVHVAIRYEVGANEDPPGKAGLAHLVEHMMFQHRPLGADKPPTFELIPQMATGFNAYTTWDQTHYYLDGRAEDVAARDHLVREEVAERHGPDDRRDEQRLDDRDAAAVERGRLEHDADGLRDEAEEPGAVPDQTEQRSRAPGLDAERERGPLPQGGREREGNRGDDREDCG